MLRIPVSDADHVQGNPNSAVVLVEYGDYQCPYCGHAYSIVKQVQQHFGDQLAFVFRNFPLTEIHPNAEAAAETAEFAASKGVFWEMHDAIYENQDSLSVETLMQLAQQLSLPRQSLEDAWINRAYRERVREDFSGGVRSGVNGTPTFFINGRRHEGAFELDDLVAAVGTAL
jgi:protein-disulfide isomerase